MQCLIFLALAIMMVVCCPAPGTAQDCIDYSDYLLWQGSADLPDIPICMEVQGTLAYVCSYSDTISSLRIVDITTPGVLTPMGEVELSEAAGCIRLSGSLACLGGAFGGTDFQVVDVSDPSLPRHLADLVTPGTVRDVEVIDSWAFLADDNLLVVDISNPESPQIVGTCPTPGYLVSLAIEGDFAFAGDSSGMLHIIDLSVPDAPYIVATLDTPQPPHCLTATGSYVLACAGGLLQVVDVSQPEAPYLGGEYDIPLSGGISDIIVSGSRALLTMIGPSGGFSGYSGFLVLDFSDPSAIHWEGSIYTPSWALGLGLSVDSAIILSYSSSYSTEMLWLDISNPTTPPLLGRLDLMFDFSLGAPGAKAANGDFLFVGGNDSLKVIDFVDPAQPFVAGSVPLLDTPRTMVVQDSHLFVANGNDGGLQAVDISDPYDPQVVDQVNIPGRARDFQISAGHAYVAADEGGLQVVDISDPTSMTIIGNASFNQETMGVLVLGSHALLRGADQTYIVDITDPQVPVLVLSLSGLRGIAAIGSIVYLMDSEYHDYHVYDFASPTNPQYLRTIECPVPLDNLYATASHLYARVTSGRPPSPVLSAIHVLDATDPANPVYEGTVETFVEGAWVGPIAVSDDFIFTGRSEVIILPLPCSGIVGIEDIQEEEPNDTPQAMVNLSVHPNPFNPRTTISFSINHPQTVELCIFDMTGKRIAVLADRTFQAGVHTMDWEGYDLQGRAVASGTYLLRMSTDERVTAEKMMLIR